MPQRPPPKLEDQMTLFSENNHGKSVVVEQVGDEIISESEVWLLIIKKMSKEKISNSFKNIYI